jgi:S1-C subfamily serine protease
VQRLSDALGRIAGTTRGVMVAAVAADGPAAGVLAPGDVVQSLDGRPIASTVDFHAIEQTRAPGKAIAVTFVRLGKTAAHMVTPVPANAAIPGASEHEPGLTLRTVAGRSVVSAVRPGSAAAQAGMQAGDVITAVGGSNGGGDITRVFRTLPQGGGTLVAIERAGRHSIVALEKK